MMMIYNELVSVMNKVDKMAFCIFLPRFACDVPDLSQWPVPRSHATNKPANNGSSAATKKSCGIKWVQVTFETTGKCGYISVFALTVLHVADVGFTYIHLGLSPPLPLLYTMECREQTSTASFASMENFIADCANIFIHQTECTCLIWWSASCEMYFMTPIILLETRYSKQHSNYAFTNYNILRLYTNILNHSEDPGFSLVNHPYFSLLYLTVLCGMSERGNIILQQQPTVMVTCQADKL